MNQLQQSANFSPQQLTQIATVLESQGVTMSTQAQRNFTRAPSAANTSLVFFKKIFCFSFLFDHIFIFVLFD